MAEIKGTNVASPIVPFTDQDIYATHEAKYGKGGYRSVNNLEELNSIPEARLEEGMLVYVINDPTGINNYQYLNKKWVKSRVSLGIPILNQDLIDEYGLSPEKDSYISIPDFNDIEGDVKNKTFTTTENGTYVDILFKALRSLQSEVAKLKNTFLFGIESYTGTNTAMSHITDNLTNGSEANIELPEEEPLWAVMEGSLSKITDVLLGDGHPFNPKNNVIVVNDSDTSFTYLKFNNNGSSWRPDKEVLKTTDSKLFLYLTTRGKNIKIKLNLFDNNLFPIEPEVNEKLMDFTKINSSKVTESDIYNTLIVISRGQKQSDGKYYGKNFIWVSISDPDTNDTLIEGYWKDDNKLYSEPVLLGEDSRYNFSEIEFRNVELTKFNLYSKWQDFSHKVIPSKPSDQDYKFKAAHITIRAVSDQQTLMSVKDQIMNNELIFIEDVKKLWIKTNNILTPIAGGGGSSEGGGEETGGMTREELIEELKKMGIVQESDNNLKINNLNLEDVVFIHQASGKRFKYFIDSEGNLCNRLISDPSTEFSYKTQKLTLSENVRGFIGNLNSHLHVGDLSIATDFRLYSDRLKIGSFYTPFRTDIVHGCSHSYVELENTSDVDINLKGCYLHYTRPNSSYEQKVYHLELTGVIPAGGTYLIRGKKHAEFEDPNVFIKVKTFDQEWFIKSPTTSGYELVSFEVFDDYDLTSQNGKGYGFVLTYGNNFGGTEDQPKELTETTVLVKASSKGSEVKEANGESFKIDKTPDYPYILHPYFIDGIYYYKKVEDSSSNGYWAGNTVIIPKKNSICKNVFELDPAKQAFQAFNKKDCSRPRWTKDTDYQILTLDKEYIVFPHTEDVFKVSNYTPRASFEHKNVCTDKTKLDKNKPNMVSSSFGIDMYKTRCFNWISIGYFPEYVWLKKGTDTSSWDKRIQSYIPVHDVSLSDIKLADGNTTATLTLKTKGVNANLSGFTIFADDKHNKLYDVVKIVPTLTGGYTITLPGDIVSLLSREKVYTLLTPDDELNSLTYPKRKSFNSNITNNIYARITGRFPADNSFYTAHKVIVDLVESNVMEPTIYSYVVGRSDKNGNPDPEHSSEVQTITLYPESYIPRIYQVTDQQGFDWIHYQVWAAAAKEVEKKIEADRKKSHIIPIIINTGDMTQNGTRINEWYDYFQAGRNLFKKYEQMNVVGNNDLCGSDPKILGTGDDNGKSNSFYFHVFYCYEVGGTINGKTFEPLVPSVRETPTDIVKAPKYVPSFYYYDSKSFRFLMMNSEITATNCSTWFDSIDKSGNPINIYTGYTVEGENNRYIKSAGFTPLYSMVWNILQDAKTKNKKVIAVCHEMPFTVITNDSLVTGDQEKKARSLSPAGKLIGSHLNQISDKENGTNKSPKGIYWFSRLLEFFGVKLVIGGHKHTYSCTYPCRENYEYMENGVKKNSKTGPMKMEETLENDSINFVKEDQKDTSKLPFVKREPFKDIPEGVFFPCICEPGLTGGVVYFMCQATGYKLTSNKELPSPNQKFSRILPETTKDSKQKDKASDNQKYPMFAIIELEGSKYAIKLARVQHIFNNFKFDQHLNDKADMKLEWIKEKAPGEKFNNFGEWVGEETKLFDVD